MLEFLLLFVVGTMDTPQELSLNERDAGLPVYSWYETMPCTAMQWGTRQLPQNVKQGGLPVRVAHPTGFSEGYLVVACCACNARGPPHSQRS